MPDGNIEQLERDRIWSMVEECGTEERHFNQLQSAYRGLASTWLIAAVGGMGYVLTKDPNNPDWNAAGWVGFMAAVGVFLLWFIDQLVYHRLLVVVFEEGKRLEENNDWLPRFRSRSEASVPAARMAHLFYGVAAGILLVAAESVFMRGAKGDYRRVYVTLGVGLFLFLFTWLVNRYQKKPVPAGADAASAVPKYPRWRKTMIFFTGFILGAFVALVGLRLRG